MVKINFLNDDYNFIAWITTPQNVSCDNVLTHLIQVLFLSAAEIFIKFFPASQNVLF